MDKGFGDTLERFTKATGIQWLIITVTGWFNINCGCKYRRDLLNKWFPYKQIKKMKKIEITIKDLLDPISAEVFFRKYWGKKHLSIRRNKFKNLFRWNDFNQYMNRYPAVKHLQIINQSDGEELLSDLSKSLSKSLKKDGRWCHDKVTKGILKAPKLKKVQVYELWKEGKTIVIPMCDYEKKDLVDICHEFEKYFGKGSVNAYASPIAQSKSFPPHADGTENFVFHQEGRTKWKIFEGFSPNKPGKVIDEFILEAGDLLYIPQYQYHEATPLGPRILLSIHFQNKPHQTLNKFAVTKKGNSARDDWYDWKPERYYKNDKIIKDDWGKMQSPTWKDKYFK